MVQVIGLEPIWFYPRDFKSLASADSATPAYYHGDTCWTRTNARGVAVHCLTNLAKVSYCKLFLYKGKKTKTKIKSIINQLIKYNLQNLLVYLVGKIGFEPILRAPYAN